MRFIKRVFTAWLSAIVATLAGCGVATNQPDEKRSAVEHNDRGTGKTKSGDLDGAIADCTKAIELNPRFVPAYYNRGVARASKGDLDGAIADCTKVIELDPCIPLAANLASLYTNRGANRFTEGHLDSA